MRRSEACSPLSPHWARGGGLSFQTALPYHISRISAKNAEGTGPLGVLAIGVCTGRTS
ncbi:hypothetical protein NSPZN2_11144 [Nitrospira defluvii]|uniref:Uncharacterized protein n=1 Tax=Nitrospira defluvii TaxID=330214 RepID=A0ABN7KVM5_9BACT|nr:hypothetical protein NSPZN2_11144 [Nitrospira defluvii]